MIRTAEATCVTLLFSLVPICMFTGCEEAGPPTGELLGKVYSNDELVNDCVVAIYNPTSKKTMGARVDGQGEFTISEVPLGEYVVTFSRMPSNSAKNPPPDKRIPRRYQDRKTTDFSVEIEEGDNVEEFKMTR